MVWPCRGFGFNPLGFSSSHYRSFTFSRFIFQMSFRLRLDKRLNTFCCKFLRRCTYWFRLSLQSERIYRWAVLLWQLYGQSTSYSQYRALRYPGSILRIQDQASRNIHQRRPATSHISHKIASLSCLGIVLKCGGLPPIFLRKHWRSNNPAKERYCVHHKQ